MSLNFINPFAQANSPAVQVYITTEIDDLLTAAQDALQANINTVSNHSVALQATVEEEITNRINGDTMVMNAVNNEKARALGVEADLSQRLTVVDTTNYYTKPEVDAKDVTLNSRITGEVTDRNTAVAVVQVGLNAEITARVDAIAALDTRITALENVQP